MQVLWVLMLLGLQTDSRPTVAARVTPYDDEAVRLNPTSRGEEYDRGLVDTVWLQRTSPGLCDVTLLRAGQTVCQVEGFDLSALLPSVPQCMSTASDVNWQAALLSMQEFHRREIRAWDNEGAAVVSVANNCLKAGLWEVSVRDISPTGYDVEVFHGTFSIPANTYENLLGVDTKALTSLSDHRLFVTDNIELSQLREVVSERELGMARISTHQNDVIHTFGEQRRKAHLVMSRPTRYSDVYAAEEICFARFKEPGLYDNSEPACFSYDYLSDPHAVIVRKIRHGESRTIAWELDIALTNSVHLIVSDLRPGEQWLRRGQIIRTGFGVHTPPSVRWANDPLWKETADSLAAFLVDEAGRLVSHHDAGLDEVWLEGRGDQGRLEVYLLSYERILVVAHWSLTLPEVFAMEGPAEPPTVPIF